MFFFIKDESATDFRIWCVILAIGNRKFVLLQNYLLYKVQLDEEDEGVVTMIGLASR